MPQTILIAALACTLALLANGARADEVPIVLPHDITTDTSSEFDVSPDRAGRPTLEVHINGEGPFDFIIDTAATRSAIGEPLAAQLGLEPDRIVSMHDLTGIQEVPLVTLDNMEVGGLPGGAFDALVIPPSALHGVDGLLGVDALKARWLSFRFPDRVEVRARRPMRVSRMSGYAKAETTSFGVVLVTGRAGRVRTKVLIDTGAQMSVANAAFREAAGERAWRRWALRPFQVVGAGGDTVSADIAIIPRLRLGDIVASDAPVVVGDFHIFHALEIADTPALILGMDILGAASELIIDYNRGEVFILP